MKYTKPELEIIELDFIDVIQTSDGGNGGEQDEVVDPTPGGSGTPIIPF